MNASTARQQFPDLFSLGIPRREIRLSSEDVRIKIYPEIDGLLATMGKPPVLFAGKVEGSVRLGERSGSHSIGKLEIEPAFLRVVTPEHSELEQESILSRVLGQILRIDRFPEIAFEISSVEAVSPHLDLRVDGIVRIHGISRAVSIRFRWRGSRTFSGELAIRQTDFGIEPLSGMMGALRAKDRVKIAITVALPEE